MLPGVLIAVVVATAIALIASAESLVSAAAVDRLHQGQKTDFDRELAAQGFGDFQRIKYTVNKNDNHFKEGERGCLCLSLSPPINMQDKCLHKDSS